jgi:cell division septum initiation protein DivIVA
VDASKKIDEITAVIEGARSMPMSASCLVNRGELLEMLDEVRRLLPDELRDAQHVLQDREDVVAQGRREADQLLAEARAERDRMVAETEVAEQAARAAEQIVADAHRQSDRMRAEVDEYVDAKLAHFEALLQRTLTAVTRGREKLQGELANLGAAGLTAGLSAGSEADALPDG